MVDKTPIHKMIDDAQDFFVVVCYNADKSGAAVSGGLDVLFSLASAIREEPRIGAMMDIALRIAALRDMEQEVNL